MIEEKTNSKVKYWLKLKKDFLQTPQMKIIKNMPNGKDYIIFYLSLMLESIENVGHLRLNSLIPYNDEMLASVTDTNIDIVRSAIKLFCKLGIIKLFDDGTIFLPEVPDLTGKETDSAERVRKHRQKLAEKKQLLLQCNGEETKCNPNKDKDKDKDKDKNIEEDKEQKEEQEKEQEKEEEQNKEKEIKENFLDFYKLYPKKVAKDFAEKAYIKARKKVENQVLIDGLKRYIEHIEKKKIERQFIKQPATWLNQGCWEDEYIEEKEENKSETNTYFYNPMG